VVQLDTIKPKLKARGTKRLKLQYDEPLLSYAFKSKLRRYGEWMQMYNDAMRNMRDAFYDPNMHGVDWPAVTEQYRPLAGAHTPLR
jgi:hypothetical protein